MKAPASGFSGNPAEEVERKNINSELWHACAGPLVSIPPAGSLVVYFPQGHSEQVAASMQKDADSIPNYSSLPSKLICLLHNVTLHADPETDEVYAEMTLQPVSKCDREAILTSDLGLKQNRQPVEFFCKTLTASDTSTHGGFSVPRRAAEKIFPPLDFSMQPPVQELCAKDLHEASWTFRHIYRGQPKRHLLTTRWSVFVSAKKLLAGDSVLFVRDEKSQLLLGIRRATRLPPSLSSSVLSSDSMQIGILAAAAHAATNNSPFTIFYNPRATPSEFVVPLAKYYKAMYTQVSVGMRFRMMFETEESGIRRYMGTITGITDLDPDRWCNSPWRNLQVGWDESAAGERRNRVSVWEIEPVATPFYFCPPFFRPKYPRLPGILDEEREIENGYKQGGGWMADDGHGKIVAGQNLMGWMGMQQTLVPSTAAGAATTFQAHGSTLPSLPPALQFPQHQQLLQQSAAALQPQQQMMMAAQQSQPRAAGGGIGHLHQEAQVQMMQSQLIMQALPNPNAQAQQNIYVLNQSAAVQPPAAQQLSPPQFQLQILQQLQQQQQVLSQLSPHLHPPQPQPPLQPYLQSQLSHQPPPPLQSQLSHQKPPQLPLPPTRARPADPHLGSIKNESRCTREADNSRHRLGTTDHLEASSSATSFCLDGGGGAEGCSVPPFSLENEVAALLPDALLLKGGTLHSLLTAANYGNQRDDPEITSQSFGAPYKPVPSAAAATLVSENGALTRGLRAPQQPRMRTYTKVQKRGSVGRCIDITQYKGYAALRRDLAAMFGIEGQLEDPHRTEWKLVYVDHENDILLVGDDPWEEFVSCVQSIKILSSSEVQQMSLDNLVNVPLDTHYDDNSGTSFGR